MAFSVKSYRVVVKGKDRRYVLIDVGRRGRRSKEDVTGPLIASASEILRSFDSRASASPAACAPSCLRLFCCRDAVLSNAGFKADEVRSKRSEFPPCRR